MSDYNSSPGQRVSNTSDNDDNDYSLVYEESASMIDDNSRLSSITPSEVNSMQELDHKKDEEEIYFYSDIDDNEDDNEFEYENEDNDTAEGLDEGRHEEENMSESR